MRIKLTGYNGPLVLYLTDGVPFLKATYLALGYKKYEVICIGGAGGFGGGLNAGSAVMGTPYSYNHLRTFGGAGGGGGFHQTSGLLTNLPSSCPVSVGEPGADAENVRIASDVPLLENGGYGGVSSFNETFCVASGGEGGYAAFLWDDIYPRGGYGGRGGLGNTEDYAGGAVGGTSDHQLDAVPLTSGADGIWDAANRIGGGGGGGAGGSNRWPGTGSPGEVQPTTPTEGGRGAYNAPMAVAPKGRVQRAPDVDQFDDSYADLGSIELSNSIDPYKVAGGGGGARGRSLNYSFAVFGSRANGGSGNGAVILRLTAS